MEKPELTPEELEALKNRHIRSFVMRRGHISAAQKRALEETFPRYQIEYRPETLDFTEAFGREANVRIVRHDAVEIVRDMIPENSLAGVHIYFPDPWRKARHHKRRLVAQPFIGMLASRIRPGGYIHCATDWENYSEQMLEVLEGEPLLENLHGKGNFSPVMGNPLCERPRTKFQARGERLGYGIWDLVYIRR